MIIFALCFLSLGGSGRQLIPEFCDRMDSPQHLLETWAKAVHSNIAIIETSQRRAKESIDYYFSVLPRFEVTEADKVSCPTAISVMAKLKAVLLRQVHKTNVLQAVHPHVRHSEKSITSFVSSFFPCLAEHLRNECEGHDN